LFFLRNSIAIKFILGGNMIKISLALLILGTTTIIAENTIEDQLDSIILIDESNQSNMKNHAVVGCDDTLKIDELKCSKERPTNSTTERILNKLPQGEFEKVEEKKRDEDIEKIKKQLSSILAQLSELKKVKENNKELREQLRNLTLIQQLVNQDKQATVNSKKIKVIERHSDHIIIRVQAGESLSKYAQKYYGDSHKYHAIRRANPKKIDSSLQIFIGDELIIPTSISFKYQKEKKKKIEKEIIVPQEKEEFVETELIPLEDNANINAEIEESLDELDEIIYVEEMNRSN